MKERSWSSLWFVPLLAVSLLIPRCLPAEPGQRSTPAVLGFEKDRVSVHVRLVDGWLRIQPCTRNMVRITYASRPLLPPRNPFVLSSGCAATFFSLDEDAKEIRIRTVTLTVAINKLSGAVRFDGPQGDTLLRESDWPSPRAFTPVVVNGSRTHSASVWFALTPEERIYGLGQHRNGVLDQRNLEFELTQDNTNISIPFWLSSKGYGVFWNNASATRWVNRFQPVVLVSSKDAQTVDYFFVYGPDFDSIIAGYRQLTGEAPLFPLWAYGYWQSKLAYKTQAELLSVAAKYRDLHIPLDNIVLDEGWETLFGSRTFTPSFPDPRQMVDTLHQQNVHLMVSIWPLFQPGSATFAAFARDGYFLSPREYRFPTYFPGTRFYDAYNPRARALYWRQVQRALYNIGVDAFWMDSSEPSDLYGEERGSPLAGTWTALGNGSRYENLYPFMTTKGIYDGQRSATGNKRAFTLTRSAFAGMQRNAAAAWSGDIATNFETLRREIPAGLNYSLSGLPYWTTDIGGFLGGDTGNPNYREVFVRWFEYGAFCPIFRVHGTRTNHENELWSYGSEAQSILTLYDRLRYRLMPYIYTVAARTTFDAYTPMRALVFDFRQDQRALGITDEFMFGPAFLVAPVTAAGASSRRVYLPSGTSWIDFWTGERIEGGQSTERAAPLETLPLYVRAGSIVPFGPESEYTNQHPDAPLELRVYPGADGSFDLYEDDGLSYAYEKGSYAQIPMHWDDEARVLTIGARQGTFPGIEPRRTFSVVLADPNHGIGEAVSLAEKTIEYTGAEVRVRF